MLLVGLTKSSKLPKIMHYRKKKKKRWLLVSAIILSWTWLVFSIVIHWTCWDLNMCPKHVKFWTYIRILTCLVHWYTWHKLNPSFTMYSKLNWCLVIQILIYLKCRKGTFLKDLLMRLLPHQFLYEWCELYKLGQSFPVSFWSFNKEHSLMQRKYREDGRPFLARTEVCYNS